MVNYTLSFKLGSAVPLTDFDQEVLRELVINYIEHLQTEKPDGAPDLPELTVLDNQMNPHYEFVMERVDGTRLSIGEGTLQDGTSLIEKTEADFEAGRPVPAGYEGCNIVAVQDGQDCFMFVDNWEPVTR